MAYLFIIKYDEMHIVLICKEHFNISTKIYIIMNIVKEIQLYEKCDILKLSIIARKKKLQRQNMFEHISYQ